LTAPDIERLDNPLTSAVLALGAAAANAELARRMELLGDVNPSELAVCTTLNHPVKLSMLGGALSLPVLSCYARQTRRKRVTFGHVDQLVTLRLHYVSSATAHERLNDRWPSLNIVWRAVSDALFDGYSSAYLDGAQVLCDAGVVWVTPDATMMEGYALGGDFAFPQWEADFVFQWRPQDEAADSDLVCFPMLGVDAQIGEFDGDLGTCHQVDIRANTALGDEVDCATPYDEESELP
jgi:hypothetical protein